jgi:hypothetical protein
MITTTSEASSVLDRRDAEAVLWRVAICAFTFYPEKPLDEPGYTIEEDVVWCTAPLAGLPDQAIGELAVAIRTLIGDPTANRRPFIATLAQLTAADQ